MNNAVDQPTRKFDSNLPRRSPGYFNLPMEAACPPLYLADGEEEAEISFEEISSQLTSKTLVLSASDENIVVSATKQAAEFS